MSANMLEEYDLKIANATWLPIDNYPGEFQVFLPVEISRLEKRAIDVKNILDTFENFISEHLNHLQASEKNSFRENLTTAFLAVYAASDGSARMADNPTCAKFRQQLKWSDRLDRKLTPAEFLIAHYGPEIKAGRMTISIIRKSDPSLYRALMNWKIRHEIPPNLQIFFGNRRGMIDKSIIVKKENFNLKNSNPCNSHQSRRIVTFRIQLAHYQMMPLQKSGMKSI